MSEEGQRLFNEYILELLASSEMRDDQFEASLAKLRDSAVAANIRQSELERHLGDLRMAFARRQTNPQGPPDGNPEGSNPAPT